MNEDRKNLEEGQKREHYEDEIELIDILRVIWKWKYFIIAGTIVFGLIAAIISFKMDKIYSIDMTLMPGILSIGESGDTTYLDSPQNIKVLIDSGAFNNDILNYLNNTKKGSGPRKLNFKVTIPKNSNTVYVKYETANAKQGMVILNHLSKLLSEAYSERIQYFKNEYDIKWNLIKHNVDYLNAIIQSCKRNVVNIEKRNNELITEIELIKKNTTNLNKERNILLSKNPQKNNGHQNLFYRYLIQQNIELSNNYKNKINDNNLEKEDQLQQIQKYASEIAQRVDEMQKIQLEKERIQNIQIVDSATKNPYPVRPKTKLNITFALVAGLFFMVFLAFFLEYLSKYREKVGRLASLLCYLSVNSTPSKSEKM
ncbi:MAG: GNVR domain-containing protein [Candidatus Hodarchaeota archaeon]